MFIFIHFNVFDVGLRPPSSCVTRDFTSCPEYFNIISWLFSAAYISVSTGSGVNHFFFRKDVFLNKNPPILLNFREKKAMCQECAYH